MTPRTRPPSSRTLGLMNRALLIRQGQLFNGTDEELSGPTDIRVEDDVIVEIGPGLHVPTHVPTISAEGRVVMPGLIDAHTHLVGWAPIEQTQRTRPDYLALRAAERAQELLRRGFTSIRDMAGVTVGMAQAHEQGVFQGPRLFWCGLGLSQTGGHGDFSNPITPSCGCGMLHGGGHGGGSGGGNITMLVDGADNVLAAARAQLGQGANHVKVFAGGGAASPTDPLEGLQYLPEELVAAVRAANDFGRYVAAHAITPEAIVRCVEAGVRTIEHANLIDLETARYCTDADVFVVPTLVIYDRMVAASDEMNLPAYAVEKSVVALEAAHQSLEHLRRAGTAVGFGTDMVYSPWDPYLFDEFRLRQSVFSPVELLRQATSVNGEILGLGGRLGVLQPGALADILVVDGNPLVDPMVLAESDRLTVVQAGNIIR